MKYKELGKEYLEKLNQQKQVNRHLKKAKELGESLSEKLIIIDENIGEKVT